MEGVPFTLTHGAYAEYETQAGINPTPCGTAGLWPSPTEGQWGKRNLLSEGQVEFPGSTSETPAVQRLGHLCSAGEDMSEKCCFVRAILI
jgi:hypothetical protein